jgi:PAS domain S-box-containing protein
MVAIDSQGRIVLWNEAAQLLYGYTPEEILGQPVSKLQTEADLRDGLSELMKRQALASGIWEGSVEWVNKDGTAFTAGVVMTPRRGKDGTPIGFLLMASGVTEGLRLAAELSRSPNGTPQVRDLNAELVQAVSELEVLTGEQELLYEELRDAQGQTAESLTLLETLLLSAPIGFGFVDRDLRIRRMNETLAAVSGIPLEEQLGRTVREVGPILWPQLEPIYRHVLDTGEPVVNHEVHAGVQAAEGEARHWLTSYYPVLVADEVIGVGLVVVDITDRQRAEEFRAVVMQNLMEGLIISDGEGLLTFMNGAASRMLGWSQYELRGKPVHTTIHYQHADGTPFADQEAPLLKAQSDGRTVRMANDAFTRKDGSIFPVAYSAGPLYSGTTVRGQVMVFRDTTEEQTERTRARRELSALVWVGRIRDALDDDRLVLYSQPIFPLSERASGGEELLVRMVGRDGGLILPGSFLPAAEKYGQVGEIDEWVITQAVRLAASGRRVHANLSADSISTLDLLPRIEQELRDADANPANIVFEITETAVMGDIHAGEAFARGIKEIGCSLALDDFGIGYGSFTYLQKLQITYLKIDITFVRDLVSNAANQHLVKAIVNIAHGLGQQTIAEGVENSETLDLLRDYGVDLVQGFYPGRPQPLTPR